MMTKKLNIFHSTLHKFNNIYRFYGTVPLRGIIYVHNDNQTEGWRVLEAVAAAKTRFANNHSNKKLFEIKVSYYVGRSESKERFAIQRYLLITGKKRNMQVLLHTFTYFST